MSNPPFLPSNIYLPFHSTSKDVWLAARNWYVENNNLKYARLTQKVIFHFDGFNSFLFVLAQSKKSLMFLNDVTFSSSSKKDITFQYLRCGLFEFLYCDKTTGYQNTVFKFLNIGEISLEEIANNQRQLWKGFCFYCYISSRKFYFGKKHA